MSTARTYVGPIVAAVRGVEEADRAAEQARDRRDLLIVAALRAGMSLDQAATVGGMSYANVRVIARKAGVKLTRGRRPVPREQQA